MDRYRLFLAMMTLSLILYVACLPFSAVSIGNEDWNGIEMLLFGWMQLSSDWDNWIWFSNPLLFMSWAFILMSEFIEDADVAIIGMTHFKKIAIGLSLLTLSLGLLSLLPIKIEYIPLAPAAQITSYGVGYWLWIASMGLAAIASLFISPRHDQDNHQN